jgi:H+/Cl- antiporter ClcA
MNVFTYWQEDIMNPIVITYLLYLAISIALTVWVAQTLFKNGRLFLVDVFHGNEALADSVNHLLVVGFYLINLGFVSLALKIGYNVEDARGSIEALSSKVGLVLLVLGAMHFFNLFLFSRIRQRSRLPFAPPPVAPDAQTVRLKG